MEYGIYGTWITEHETWNNYTEHGIRNIYVHTKKIKAMGINVVTIRRLGNGTSQWRPGDNAMGRHGRGYAARKRF